MSPRNLFTLASAVLATVSQVSAQILSCADVDCPIANDGTTAANCTLIDKTFNAVGVADIGFSVKQFSELSWVKAVRTEDQYDSNERVFDQSFYLATPNDFEGGASGCVLFFTEVSERVKFGDDNIQESQGTCKDALTESCISALTDRAKAVDLDGLSNKDACQKLEKNFSENFDSDCASFATGKRWSGIKVQALSGPGAPEPISKKQNESSNCWPILPKTDDLRLVQSVYVNGTTSISDLMKNLLSITPILTVLFKGDNSQSVVNKTEAQLTCLKTIDLTTASNATKSSGGDGNSATGRFSGVGGTAMWIGLASMTFAALLV